MATTASEKMAHKNTISAWAGFKPGLWQREINVRDFIQQNYEPFEGTTLSWRLQRSAQKSYGTG